MMKIFYSEKCLEYISPGHPESPTRVYEAYEHLREKGFDFVEPKPCSVRDLLLVHDRDYVERIRRGRFHDGDSPNLPGIYDYARLAVGSSILAMKAAMGGEESFSLMRPPGHHAGRGGIALGASSLGFCYFNNVAVASQIALRSVDKVAIVDIDCHHGNGTQEIFQGKPGVLFVSIHRYGYFYPGTGGRSEGNCLNYPLTKVTGDVEYLSTLNEALVKVERFHPDLIGVSAGFDTYIGDPVGGLGLGKEAYIKMGEMIGDLKKPTFTVLEGGYGPDFPDCIYNFLVGLK
jgi:acetoin utilization deacetylase AcuC-like enzyme